MEYLRCPRCKNDIPVTYLFCPYCGLDLRFIAQERLLAALSIKDILNRIRYLFYHPIIAVKHIATAPDFLGALLVFALCSMTLFLKNLAIYMLHPGAGAPSREAIIIIFLMSALLQFLIWFLMATLFHIAIMFVGGKGTFGAIFNLLGYTMIYVGLGHLFSLFLAAATGLSNPANLLPAYSYAPFYVVVAFLSGYGYSYTHLLRKITSISATVIATVLLMIVLYLL